MDGEIDWLETKAFAISSIDGSMLYVTKNYELIPEIMKTVLSNRKKWKLISITNRANINYTAGSIPLNETNHYNCTLVPDGKKSSKLSRIEWEGCAKTFMTNWFIKSGFNNKFSASFNELPTDLIMKALELGCNIKIKSRKDASLTTGLYRLTVIPPKNKDYEEEK